MNIMNISVRAVLGEDRVSFIGPFGEFLERFARDGERYEEWKSAARAARLGFKFPFEGNGLKGYLNGDGIPQIEQAPDFREAWMVMAMAAKTGAHTWEIERRFDRHQLDIRLLAEGWAEGNGPAVNLVIHDKWMRLMEEAWAYRKESPFADGYCSVAPRVFQLLTGREYPVAFCY